MSNVVAEPYREIVLRPKRGLNPIPFRELWQFRDLLFTLAQRDVKLRYRQTALGAIWVVLQPLIGAGLFSFVFGSVAKLPSQGVPYFIFAYAGLLGWAVFNSTLSKASSSLVGNANLVSKIYFPRLILPFSCTFAVLLDFCVGFFMLLVLLAIYHIGLTVGILALPVLVFTSLAMAMGLGLFAASLMVSYRDVGYIVPVFTQFLLYASPVAYAASLVRERAGARVQAVFGLNPLVGLLEAFRWSCLGTPVANWGAVAYSAVFAVVVLVLGALSFQRMERRFADVI
ncbi:MAG: ABC transporter permease [Fimbriimonadaceae bacterium]